MSRFKFTPGPWEIKDDYIVGGPYGQPICKLECWPTTGDAQAIAALPELVEALETAIKILEVAKCTAVVLNPLEEVLTKVGGKE
jgi:hypothetical protein